MSAPARVGLSTDHIDYLQRRAWPVRSVPFEPATSAPPDHRRLLRVYGRGHLTAEPRLAPPTPGSLGPGELRQPMPGTDQRCRPVSEDLLVGLSGYSIPVAFLVTSDGAQVAIHAGTWSPVERERVGPNVLDSRQAVLRSVLESVFPALDAEPAADALSWPTHGGLVLGVPTAKPDATGATLPLDRLIRALTGCRWAVLVLADPVDEIAVAQLRHSVINELRAASAAGEATMAPSPLTQVYTDLLTSALAALAAGEATGAWRTAVYLLGDGASYFRLASVWRSVFGGEDSRPEPVRVWDDPRVVELAHRWALPDVAGGPGPGHYEHPFGYQTLLTSAQLAAYVHLPALETVGYRVRGIPQLDVTPPPVPADRAISVGQVTERGRPTAACYEVRRDDLTRHALVAGVTGSGKTNTMFHLLKQLWRAGIPFLVLEPAKTEYRALLADTGIGAALRVFTLGEERVSPLRLNPFEVQPGVPVATHIDLLKSLFNASFGMWHPLPQVLERCIHAVYRDAGWDTVANRNRRLAADTYDERAFPTLTDLYDKVTEVVESLGYEERVSGDLKAALMTRLHSLRIGGKGVLLDTRRSVPFGLLLNRPTIVELEPVGDDDEKAFLMGLLLMRLYENHRATGSTEGTGLSHVVVVEEAHRLLANVATASMEEGNVRGKAVEAFTNMLSEVRAYGQAFLVAEQIPTKLAPDVIKNTNLKIVHRTVAGDDRWALAASMNLGQQESDMLAVLGRGEAVVFAEGDDRPILVAVPYAKVQAPPSMRTKAGADRVVTDHMRQFHGELPIDAFLPFDQCAARCGTPYAYCEVARQVCGQHELRTQLSTLVLALALPGGEVAAQATQLAQLIRSHLPARLSSSALPCVVMNGVQWFWTEFGRRYGWSYTAADLQQRLTAIALDLIAGEQGHDSAASAPRVEAFAADYRRLCQRVGDPFPSCARLCPDGSCLFRFHAAELLRIPQLSEPFDAATAEAAAGIWRDFSAVDDAADRLVGSAAPWAARRAAGLCFAVQRLAFLPGLPAARRRLATDLLLNGFDARSEGGSDEPATGDPRG